MEKQKQSQPVPVKPTVEVDRGKTGKEREDAATSAGESADTSGEERKIGFARTTDGGETNARDPQATVKADEDAGEPANPADHADIQGE